LKNITNTRITLGDKAFQSIKDAILSLELKPGQSIYEAEIASQLGVSRTPVREAFSRLRQEELIEIYPQKGVIVAPISIHKLNEVRFVRESLEISSFKKIAEIFDLNEPKCRKLDEKLLLNFDQGERAFSVQDLQLFFKTDNSYHSQFLEFLENKTLLDTIMRMNCHIARVRFLELKETKNMPEVLIQHHNIYNAIKDNDVKHVEELLIDHFSKFHIDQKLMHKYPGYFEK